MAVIDLVTGLAYIEARVGLRHLDRDLRASLDIRPDDVPAEQQLATLNAQLADLEDRIGESKKQADWLYKRGAYTQSTELQAQTTQLYTQLQKLQVDRPRLESEAKTQRRAAEDEELLRMLADLYTHALTARQAEQYVDFALVTLAMFRVHRQIYPDIAEGEGRLQLAELQDKLFEELRELIGNAGGRTQLATSYLEVLQGPLALQRRAAECTAQAQIAVAAVEPLHAAPAGGAWAAKLAAADECRAALAASQAALAALHQEAGSFAADPYLAELFFPAAGDPVAGLLGGLQDEWAASLDEVAQGLGMTAARLHTTLQDLPADLDRWRAEVAKALEETDRLRVTHQLGGALLHLAEITRRYGARFQELSGHYAALQPGAGGAVRLADTWLALDGLRCALALEFKGYGDFVDAASFAGASEYGLAATTRLKAIGADEDVAPVTELRDAFVLRTNIAKLESDVTRGLAVCRRGIDRAIASYDEFCGLEAHLRAALGDPDRAQAESRIAAYQPDVLAQARSALRGEAGKELERRRRVIEVLLSARSAAQTPSDSQGEARLALPPVAGGPALPALGTRRPGLVARLPQGRSLWFAMGTVLVLALLLALAIAAAGGLFNRTPAPASTRQPTPALTVTPAPAGLTVDGSAGITGPQVNPTLPAHTGQIYLLLGPTPDDIVRLQRSDITLTT